MLFLNCISSYNDILAKIWTTFFLAIYSIILKFRRIISRDWMLGVLFSFEDR